MVRAILEGRKTQTRRTIKPGNSRVDGEYWNAARFSKLDLASPAVAIASGGGTDLRDFHLVVPGRPPHQDHMHKVSAAWRPGMLLWVRESWTVDADIYQVQRELSAGGQRRKHGPYFRADSSQANTNRTWRQSTHLPRWASRITLRISGMRPERLQEISIGDCYCEGVVPDEKQMDKSMPWSGARQEFQLLWERLNGPESWQRNPWVWVFEFGLVTIK